MTPSRSTRTSGKPRPSWILRAVAGAAAATLALAGCSAGQVGTIGSQVASVNGGQGAAGSIAVRDVTVQFPTNGASFYPAGADAPLLFTVTNSGLGSDELVSITTPAAAGVQLVGPTTLPGGTSLASSTPTKSGSATASTSSSAASAPAASSTSADAPEIVPYPVSAVLSQLTQDVKPGLNIPVTFTFARAGAITMPVPVGAPDVALGG